MGWPGSKFFADQGRSDQSSSLMKMPRYSTEGDCSDSKSEGSENAFDVWGFTSPHHTQGDTPIRRLSSRMP